MTSIESQTHHDVPAPPEAAPPPVSKRLSQPVVLIVVLGTACILLVLGIAFFFRGTVREAVRERPNIEQIIDQYMLSMEAKDADAAYLLFSARAQRQVPVQALHDLFEGHYYALFEGYRSVEITEIYISSTFNSDPDVPQGRLAEVNGTISYEGGFTGSFEALLEREDGEWKLDSIFVYIPPEKLDP